MMGNDLREYRAELFLTAALQEDAGEGRIPSRFQIFPAGLVEISGEGPFTVDEESMDEVVRRFEARGVDMVVDYEHQTEEGSIAPAAGWIKQIENRGGDGLWARVEWTRRASGFLAKREYRYFSPVFLVSKSERRLVELLRVALTNAPRLNGIRPIVAALKGRPESSTYGAEPAREEKKMEFLESCATALGLARGASETDVVEEIGRLRDRADVQGCDSVACKEVLEALELTESSERSEVVATIHALRQRPDLGRELESVKRRLAERDRNDLVEAALKGGKLTPAQKDWACAYALRDPEGFRIFTAKAPQIVPTGELNVIGDAKMAGAGVPDDLQLQVNRLMGVSGDSWKKYGPRKDYSS